MASHEVLDPFVDWLTQSGFALEQEAGSPGFGDSLQVFGRGLLRIRLLSDRGQWFLELSSPLLGDNWFDADLWRAHHAGLEAPDNVSSLGDQVDYFRTHMTDIQIALGSTQGAEIADSLRGKREARARRRLGLAQ